MTTSGDLLEMRGIDMAYPGVQSLRGVDLTLRSGEVLALVGENSAGKSTLLKILRGAVTPDSGTIRIAGEQAFICDPIDARRVGVALIYEEFNLAKWLHTLSKVVIFDESIREIDVGARYAIYLLMNALVAQDMAVRMVSSEFPEMLAMADHILVRSGRQIASEIRDVTASSQEEILKIAIGWTPSAADYPTREAS